MSLTTFTLSERLTGLDIPNVALAATDGTKVRLANLDGTTVVYIYPRTSPPNGPAIPGWDAIPGAKGCTPQSCGFRDHFAELQAAGADSVFGLSVQDSAYQAELVARLHLPFPILSDEKRALQTALDLPAFQAGGMVLLERCALVLDDGCITAVFHPITDPASNAADILTHLRSRT